MLGRRRVHRPAHELKRLLDELGIAGYPKTAGSRGLHIYVRLQRCWDFCQVRSAAVAIACELERRRPDLITAAWWKVQRGPRVFVDCNQNEPRKTVFGAWSVRARAAAQVSTPVAWAEIDEIHPDRRPLARYQRRPAVTQAAARDERAGPGERLAGRAMAARLPETTGRAVPCRPQPREKAHTRCRHAVSRPAELRPPWIRRVTERG
jgi:DNA primase